MTRILQLIPSFEPGGAERQLAYLCQGLRDLGFEVHVAMHRDGPLRGRIEAAGAQIHTLPARNNYDPLLVLRVLRLIRSLRPIAVQTWLPQMDVVGGVAARLAGVPWVLTERTAPLGLPRTFKLWLRATLARGAAGVISNSAEGDAYWQSRLAGAVPRALIHNALPLDELASAEPPSLREFGLPDEAPLVLCLGRLDHGKSVDVVIRALARVVAASDAVGLICGSGPLDDAARRWLDEAALAGRVVLTGFVPNAYRLLKRASALITLSELEGMPNAVMEAMALGCPIVASDIRAHREILDAQVARLVPIDERAAAEAILEILRDPAPAAQRAQLARARAARWSIADVAGRHRDFFAAISAGAAAGQLGSANSG